MIQTKAITLVRQNAQRSDGDTPVAYKLVRNSELNDASTDVMAL